MRNKYVTPAMLEALKVAFSSAEYDAEAERPALYIAAEGSTGASCGSITFSVSQCSSVGEKR